MRAIGVPERIHFKWIELLQWERTYHLSRPGRPEPSIVQGTAVTGSMNCRAINTFACDGTAWRERHVACGDLAALLQTR
jgi:hypothetical protein